MNQSYKIIQKIKIFRNDWKFIKNYLFIQILDRTVTFVCLINKTFILRSLVL